MTNFRIVDADCHILEPPDIWKNWLGSQWQDKAPKLVKPSSAGANPGPVAGVCAGRRWASRPSRPATRPTPPRTKVLWTLTPGNVSITLPPMHIAKAIVCHTRPSATGPR